MNCQEPITGLKSDQLSVQRPALLPDFMNLVVTALQTGFKTTLTTWEDK